MKSLVVLLAILFVAFAAVPKVETWSRAQLQFAMKLFEDNPIHAHSQRCVEAALEVMAELYDDSTTKLKPSGVVIPAPSGAVNWTIDELTNALNIIAKYEAIDIETRSDENDTTIWTTDEVMELMFATAFPDPIHNRGDNRMVREINDCIMFTMYYVSQNISKYDPKKHTFPVLLPAVDISTWTLPEINKILSPKTKPKASSPLIPYLQKARNSKTQRTTDGKKYCVITPVGKIPQKDRYYYLPQTTRRLLKMARVSKVKRLKKNKTNLELVPTKDSMRIVNISKDIMAPTLNWQSPVRGKKSKT